jgi:autotransporter-associated beta strand protein
MSGSSSMSIGGWFTLGRGGPDSNGALEMSGDSTLTVNGSFLGIGNAYGGNGHGEAWLSDNATMTSAGDIAIAWGGEGVLHVGDGTETDNVVAQATTGIQLGHSTGAEDTQARIDLNAGGTLMTSRVYTTHQADNPYTDGDEFSAGTISSVINFDGGVLVATADDTPASGELQAIPFITNDDLLVVTTNNPETEEYQAAWYGGSQDFQLNVKAGGAIIDTNGHAISITEPLSAGEANDGGLTKLGDGTLTLTGDSTYTGDTVVAAGILSIAGSITSNVTVDAGASLTGDDGLITGDVDVNGALAAMYNSDDDTIDLLSISGLLDLDGATISVTDLGSGIMAEGTYMFASYGSLSGTPAGTEGLLPGWSLDYDYEGNNIALIVTPVSPIPGDTNGDNEVDAVDAAKLAENWGSSDGINGAEDGDFNDDGIVNILDAAILAANWTGTTGEATAVPEPSMIGLLLLGLAMCGAARRRR